MRCTPPIALFSTTAALLLFAGPALSEGPSADREELAEGGSGDPLPKELEGVDVTEKLGSTIRGDLEFRTDQGQRVKLEELVGSGRPLILTFNYSNCPLLCSVQLGGLTDALAGIERTPGESFRIVTVVLDPNENPEQARETKKRYLEQLASARKAAGLEPAADADEGWTFLVGSPHAIRTLADSVGFGYVYHPGRKEYLHPAVFMLITPSGRIAQYVYGVHFESTVVEGAIASAAMDITSESGQAFILSCYHYEAPEGWNAFRIMQIAGTVFGIGFVLILAGIHLKSRLSRRPAV